MTTSLRLHTPTTPATAPRSLTPGLPQSLTLGETLAEIRRLGVPIRRTSTGVALIHKHLLPTLGDAVHRHNTALAVWLDMGRSTVVPGLESWGEGVRLHARWLLERLEAPSAPFALRPGEMVMDWDRFTSSLMDRLALGPDAPGDAADVLASLFDRFALGQPRPAIARRRHAA